MSTRFGGERTTPRPDRAPLARDGWYDLADLGCAGLSAGLAVASVRLFSNTEAVVALAAVGLGSWLLASALRRTSLPGWVADLTHLGIGVVLLAVLAAPAERWGFLPTASSVQAVVTAVRHDFTRFDQDVAPLAAGVGHLVVMSALIWILALFNSTSAMRLRAPVQGVIPHLVAFVGLGFVAREPGRVAASVAMFVAVGTYAVTQVAWRNAANNWMPRGTHVAARSLAAGFGILAAAGVISAVAVPLLPGDSDPVVDLRRGGLGEGGPRTVVSPFVEVGSNLGPRSNELLFNVESDTPQYWRLTALDTYDPDKGIWILSNSYTPVDGELAPGGRSTGSDVVDVRGLGGIWIPTPDDSVSAEASFGLNWDPDAESLIRRSGDLTSGDEITVGTGGTPDADIDLDELRSASPANLPGGLVDASGAPPQLTALAEGLARNEPPYTKLLALQDYFHDGFTYDETIDLSASDDPLGEFLEVRRGFCQQFATAFALGARSLGYPARVVVGFTPGDRVGADTEATSVFAVRGRHAHAWPEVRFAGIGWVPFEPTPGRGNPAATAITGVRAEQAAPPGDQPPEQVPPTTQPAAGPTSAPPAENTDPVTEQRIEGGDAAPGSAEPSPSPWLPVALVASGVAAVAAGGLVVLRRRSRRRGTVDPHPVAAQWRKASEAMERRGLNRAGSETPTEYARRCDDRFGTPGMITLAELETVRLWAPWPTGESDVATAAAAAASVVARLEELDGSPAERVAVAG